TLLRRLRHMHGRVLHSWRLHALGVLEVSGVTSKVSCWFFFILSQPPPSPTLFPYTTLFRSTRARAGRTLTMRRFKFQRSRNLKRSEEHTSELQSQSNLVCRLLLEKKHSYC